MLTAEERRKIRNKIARLTVDKGSHSYWSAGHCVMEIVSKVANQSLTDRPHNVCPFTNSLMIHINDSVSGDVRQELKRLVPFLLESNDGNTLRRAWWLIRTFCLYASTKRKGLAAENLSQIAELIRTKNYDKALEISRVTDDQLTGAIIRVMNNYCERAGAYVGAFLTSAILDPYADLKKQTKFINEFICIVRRSLKIDIKHLDCSSGTTI